MTEQPSPDELPPYGRSDPTASCRYCPQPVKPEDDPMVWIDHIHWAHAACFERHHTPSPNALAEAERRARLLRDTDGAHWVGLPPILDELDRLRLVEQAATTLVDVWDEQDGLCCNKHATPALRALAAAVRTETP